ncbi:MAG: hypothetical protein GC204_14030 [Chloroflexi bacterium]|nr:hypothetical protein [Chloroflexota bacterium]
MVQARSKVIFKILVVLLCAVLATYAGLFLAYQQIMGEAAVYAEHLSTSTRVGAAVAAKLPR